VPTLPTAKCGKFDVSQYFFQFCYRYLKIWHLLYPTISYVNESRRWQTFSLFALSELVYSLFSLSELVLVCTKNVICPIILFPTYLPQADSLLERYRQTDRFQHPFHPYFFLFSTQRAGPYPQAQLYWVGRTMGWMADWTSSPLLTSSMLLWSPFRCYLGLFRSFIFEFSLLLGLYNNFFGLAFREL